MTIPEAAHLVLEAGSMAAKSEIYVLDMGKPVKILDLAENMIKLSGFTPYVDIDIDVIGLRPGEKLYEELLIKTEELDKTDNSLIFIERDICPTRAELDEKLSVLSSALESCDNDKMRDALMQVVPTFHSAEEVNRNAEVSNEMQMAHA
jgi:FlaA1/EpsC-like NDP-sugar epimerase